MMTAVSRMTVVHHDFLERIKAFGIGRRKLNDELFSSDEAPPILGIHDVAEEELCHSLMTTACTVPGCKFTAESLLEFENHYNSNHRYTCHQCKKKLPSPHLLDLHIQETHDSFFAVLATRKPSYCCYIEECKDKFLNPEERLQHCIEVHKLPKDFRFDKKPKQKNKNMKSQPKPMDLDDKFKSKQIKFNNSKSKVFPKYTGKKFTNDKANITATADIDEIMTDLHKHLP